MKHKLSSLLILLIVLGALVTSSCKKTIDEAYINPNANVIEPIETILPGVIGGFTAFFSSQGTNYGLQQDATFLGRYIQYWGVSTAIGENYGTMGPVPSNSDQTGSVWGIAYYGHGQNVNKIIKWGIEQQKWDYVGVGLAVRAWDWLELTDEYSDAILKEAFNTSLQQFHYDTQPEFYDSCRAICFRSLAFLSRTDGNVNQANLAIGDAFFYNGDVNKWKKFVYGILARSYINLSNKTLYTTNHFGDSAIKYAGLSIATNEDNATVKLQGGIISATNNFFGPFRGNIGTLRQSQYISDLMSGSIPGAFTGVSDPRAWYMLRENTNGTFKGVVPWLGGSGLSGSDFPQNFWGNPISSSNSAPVVDNSRYLFQNTSPWPIMTASEMQFIIAEAQLRNGNNALALAAYTKGISLNIDMLTTTYPQNVPAARVITPTVKSDYLSNTAIVPLASNLTMSHIMLQKFIALYAWGAQETWCDLRKFHYVDAHPTTNGQQVYTGFTPPSGIYLSPTNNGKLAYRFKPRYNSEYIYNVPELTRIGAFNPDYNTMEMWFSQR